MKKLVLLLSMVCGVMTLRAQSHLQFENVFYDFGKIAGIQNIEYKFRFKNTGTLPIKIRKVESDCACLSSVHSSESIQPNQSSAITVKYSPYRAGHFSKKFVVLTDGNLGAYELTIRGFIEPSSDKKVREFQYQKGALRFKRKYLNFGTIAHNTPVSRKFEVYNPSDTAVVFTDKITAPKHIGLFFDSTHIIAPKSSGFLVVTYNPKLQSEHGYLQESVMMYTKNEQNQEVPMTVSIHLLPQKQKPTKAQIRAETDQTAQTLSEKTTPKDTLQVSENQALGSPKIVLSEPSQNLGEIYPKMTVSTEFEILNQGRQPLVIEDIVGGKNCIIQKIITEPIPAGESRVLEVQIVQSVRQGEQKAVFTIFSNDPEHPQIQGEIVVKVITED